MVTGAVGTPGTVVSTAELDRRARGPQRVHYVTRACDRFDEVHGIPLHDLLSGIGLAEIDPGNPAALTTKGREIGLMVLGDRNRSRSVGDVQIRTSHRTVESVTFQTGTGSRSRWDRPHEKGSGGARRGAPASVQGEAV